MMSVLLWYKSLISAFIKPERLNLGSILTLSLDLEKIALIDTSQENPRKLSYRQLNNLSDAVARSIQNENFAPQARIAIIADNSSEYLASYFGIMRAGMVAVLINHKLPSSQIIKLLNSNNVKIVFCDSSQRKKSFTDFKVICFQEDFNSWLDYGPFTPVKPSKDCLAFLIFTSGSTSGEPKCVAVTHKEHLWILKMRLPPDSNYTRWMKSNDFKQILSAPMYHMGGLTNIETTLMGQGQIILMPHFNPDTFANAIETYKVTSVKGVPPMLAIILANKDLLAKVNLSSVLAIHLGGAPLTQSLLNKIKRHFPNVKNRIYNSYGSTELGAGLFQHQHPEKKPVPQLSVGYPRSGIEYRIIDGILQVKTPSRKDFYVTNDLFYKDENGFYFCTGRADDMFISGGENIYPSEIEAVIESHPDIESAIIVALDDEIKGSKPYAFVTMKQNAIFDEGKLKQYILQNSPSYHLPRNIWQLQELPLTLAFKVDRRSLKLRAQELKNKI